MLKTEITNNNAWANLHKIVFRFFFIYFLLYIAPWTWIFDLPIPGFETISNFYSACIDWFVNAVNKYFFHVRPVLVPTNGSGDTSFGWAQVCLFLSLAIFGTTVWTLLDIRRKNYTLLDYWFRTIIRYNLAMIAMGYGLAKVFLSQMPFPTESLLSTNLGDLLPMRLSWLFIGYSAPYEIFAGAMEIIAAVLLLNRKTITFGLFVATGVFIHVMVLNLCYDIPVKIFSIHLVLYCLYLLANDFKRLWNFLVINKTTPPNTLYELRLDTKRKRIYRIVIKTLIIAAFFIFPFWTSLTGFLERDLKNKKSIFGEGIYNVQTFVRNNKDTIPILARDTLV